MQTTAFDSALTLLRRAQSLIALTGAGISTRSGIPDFRSPDSGLWETVNPAEVASIYGFRHNPARFYDWIRPYAQLILNAQPNPAHLALTRLEALGKLKAIITQNIDMLHTAAGSHTVYEVHGHFREMTCIHCFATYPAEPLVHDLLNEPASYYPICPACQHALKPNVILFGEQLPATALLAAQRAVRTCDTLLVIGSSLEVFPTAQLPQLAQQHGAALIIINLTPTPLDSIAQAVLHADAADVLPQLATALENDERL